MIRNHRLRKLIAPTAGLRHALLVSVLGLLCFLVGVALSFKRVLLPMLDQLSNLASGAVRTFVAERNLDVATHLLGGGFLMLGLYLLFHGVRFGFRTMIETLNPGLKSGVVDVYVRRQQLAQGPRIVALGGGTGLSTLLRGLKQHSSNITAIVTVTDDGGSSGRLIKEKQMIPPGDIRNCLVALADAEKSMTDLFQHRFAQNSGSLSGHAVGNLLIAALVDQAGGDFERAVEIASDVLAIRGRVVPSTLDPVRLRAIFEDGTELCGETAIVQADKKIRRVALDPECARPHPAALEAIRAADLICIGPGSVFTSVIPNLLIPGIPEAIRASNAAKAYVCNVMTQPGESESFSASEHVLAVQLNIEARLFDYVLMNNARPSQEAIEKYRESGQHLVEADADRVRALGFRPLLGNFLSETDFVRHDPLRVATKLIDLAE